MKETVVQTRHFDVHRGILFDGALQVRTMLISFGSSREWRGNDLRHGYGHPDISIPGREGKALGITVASTYLGLSLGPFWGISDNTFWLESIFLVNVPLGLQALSWSRSG